MSFGDRLGEERKQVTLLFADVKGSTSLIDGVDPEDALDLLTPAVKIMVEQVERYGGTVSKVMGDGIMAIFGAPLAQEDHAIRACHAALAMQKAMRERNSDPNSQRGPRVEIRVGLHSGKVVVRTDGGDAGYDAAGFAVHLASRIEGLTQPGTVCVTAQTRRLAGTRFAFRPLGTKRVKGSSEPVVVYQLLEPSQVRPESADSEGLGIHADLVGRHEELSILLDRAARLRDGMGAIVCILGEAGVGKTRLLAEFRAHLEEQAGDARWLVGPSVSFGRQLSYWPFVRLFRDHLGVSEEDTGGSTWRALSREVERLFPEEPEEVLPYLARFLGLEVEGDLAERIRYLDAGALRPQIFRAVRRLLGRLAGEGPLILIFEDAYWMDESSAELLNHILGLVAERPILFVIASRRETETADANLRAAAAREHGDFYTELGLGPLARSESRELIGLLLPLESLPPSVTEAILDRAEGNPLYVEEVIRSLLEGGAIRRDRASERWSALPEIERIEIPTTIHGVIMSRVDRLEREVKETLKLASIIGRTFFFRVLEAFRETSDALQEHLLELTRAEFILEKEVKPELEYMFRHALVQEATYRSILRRRRKELHQYVAEVLEGLFADRREEFAGVLAYHYARGADWEKAQEYLFLAGNQAEQLAADAEALGHFLQAVRAYSKAFGDRWDPIDRADVERKIGEAFYRRGENEAAIEHLRLAMRHLSYPPPTAPRSVPLGLAGQLLRQLLRLLFPRRAPRAETDPRVDLRMQIELMMCWVHFFEAPELFVYHTLRGLNFAEKSRHRTGMTLSSMGVGFILDVAGRRKLAERYHRRSLELAEGGGNPLELGNAHLGWGWHHAYGGSWEEALEAFRHSAEACWEAGDVRGWGSATWGTVLLACYRGGFGLARETAERIHRIGLDSNDRTAIRWSLLGQGMVDWRTGSPEEGLQRMMQAYALALEDRDSLVRVHAAGEIAQCNIARKELDAACTILDEIEGFLAKLRLRGHHVTVVRNARADASLALASKNGDSGLRLARAACRKARRETRHFSGGFPQAARAAGTLSWLVSRDREAADRWFMKSIEAARNLAAPYEEMRTHEERAHRLEDAESAEAASRLAGELGL